MRPVSQFTVVFAVLLALSALPAWRLLSKFDVRIKAYEQQKRVGLKRPMLEHLQETLHQAHQATLRALPASATTVAGKLIAVNEETLAGLRWEEVMGKMPMPLEEETTFFFLSYFDAAACIHLVAQFPSFAGHRNDLGAGSIPSGTEEGAMRLTRFVPPRPSPEPLSRAVGNAIRGLEGYSLVPYKVEPVEGAPDAERDEERRYGAWLWDREHRFGMALEVPAEALDAQIAQEQARFVQGRRFLYFLCVASYLMILAAFARLAQRWLFRPTQRPSH